VKTIGNLIWLVLVGWLLALQYFVVGVILCITIIGIPFGVQCFKLAGFVLWPYGWTLERRADADGLSTFGNVLWFILAGLWIAITQVLAGIAFCITIIGIPLGLASFKLAGVALAPFGRERVPTDRPLPAV